MKEPCDYNYTSITNLINDTNYHHRESHEPLTEDPFASSVCGVLPTIGPRIAGGFAADVEYPWFALLKRPQDMYGECGGTLITNHHVLTAAHCYSFNEYESYWKNEFVILLGVTNICDLNENTEKFNQDWVIIHPEFHPENVFTDTSTLNDIAVVKLAGTSKKIPICLPDLESQLPHHGEILGMGYIKEDELNKPCELQKALVDMYDQKTCKTFRDIHYNPFHIKDDFLCTNSDTDTCKGDSGGPLQCLNEENVYTLYGITSLGVGCGKKNIPGIYTDVLYHVPWIKNITYSTPNEGSEETNIQQDSHSSNSIESSKSLLKRFISRRLHLLE
ncbi:brain-specific serine protease 4-like [Phlebotomus argentipes]|uniref:brain-specific serine protease 4-like n=1 Tax=Phlebotomus argentipes TaxID=94469 RepID=UPI00289324D6|nr:brain-specific serine protease 4-like [Phlebotomus argentipes]